MRESAPEGRRQPQASAHGETGNLPQGWEPAKQSDSIWPTSAVADSQLERRLDPLESRLQPVGKSRLKAAHLPGLPFSGTPQRAIIPIACSV